jgi:Protein of unknown function (DUF1566)
MLLFFKRILPGKAQLVCGHLQQVDCQIFNYFYIKNMMNNIQKSFTKLMLTVSILPFGLIAALPSFATCRTDLYANAPDGRFETNSNGTVIDKKTLLMWKRCSEGLSGPTCAIGSPQKLNWKAAFDTSVTSSYASFSDWRVPNVKELASLVERRCFSPAINEAVFPNTPRNDVWSSTFLFDDLHVSAYIVNFDFGPTGILPKFYEGYVRLVRGGQ